MAPGSKSRKDPVTIDVVEISPNKLLNVRKYECDTCCKGFIREQNLRLHGRAHNLPFTLRRNSSKDRKKVYVCPEPTCIYHNPSHAIGDLGGLKKHYFRKHVTEKNHKCDTCSKSYAAEVDLKAHSKICGKMKHKCSCGMEFQKKCSLNHHMNHYCSSRNSMGNSLANVTINNHTEIGSTSSRQTTTPFNMEHNSARITTNLNNSTLTPQKPSVQITSYSYPKVSHYEPQLYDFEAYQGSHMTSQSMGSNSCHTVQDFQNNFTEGSYMQMLMGDNVSIDSLELYKNFNGGSIYNYQESIHNTSLNANAMMDNGPGGGAGSFNQDCGHGY